MTKGSIGSWTVAAATLLLAAPAGAEDGPGALDLTVGIGFDQGFGSVADGVARLQDIGAAGGAMDLGIGWRIDPHITVGLYGSGSVHAAGEAVPRKTRAYAAGAGFMVSYHGLPHARFDPWIGMGIGWRGYWIEREEGTEVLGGLDLSRIQAGLDYALSERMSVSPALGVSLARFEIRKAASEGSYRHIADSRMAVFVFGGVLGRFEVLGRAPARAERVARD